MKPNENIDKKDKKDSNILMENIDEKNVRVSVKSQVDTIELNRRANELFNRYSTNYDHMKSLRNREDLQNNSNDIGDFKNSGDRIVLDGGIRKKDGGVVKNNQNSSMRKSDDDLLIGRRRSSDDGINRFNDFANDNNNDYDTNNDFRYSGESEKKEKNQFQTSTQSPMKKSVKKITKVKSAQMNSDSIKSVPKNKINFNDTLNSADIRKSQILINKVPWIPCKVKIPH